MAELRTEIKSLQGDNLKLYEKLRYMQSYRDDSGPSQIGGRASANPFEGGDDLGKYRSRYEESMNPFTKFQSRVSYCLIGLDEMMAVKVLIRSQIFRKQHVQYRH